MRTRRPALLILSCLGLALAVALFFAWRNRRAERRYDSLIRVAAARYRADPALVKAVIWRESRFNSLARGKAEEIGLMQIREEAALEWADTEHVEEFAHEHCLDPATNILAGTHYLAKLMRRYRAADNPVPYALADYNAGRANVLRWGRGPGTTNSALFIEAIGFPGTKAYVRDVMEKRERYR